MHSRPFCDYRRRGREICVCKACGQESQLKSNVPSRGVCVHKKSILYTCVLLLFIINWTQIPSHTQLFQKIFASFNEVYSIPITFSLFLHVGRKSAARCVESGHVLRPNRSYTVYLNIPLIFHQLDADSVPEPAVDHVNLRPNRGYTVYQHHSVIIT